jgi:GNAT superfamily N-acetyltransferase
VVRHGHLRQPREGSAAPRPSQGALALRRVDVVRTYLTLDDRAQLRPKAFTDPDARVERRAPCPVPLYRRLYKEVGEPWYWHDRLEWSDEELSRYLALPNVGVWELFVGERSAGYFELLRHDDDSVEIAYFGLISNFMARGLGGPLLTRAVEEAWAMGARRVWLHTCTLDSERALPTYKARGFREYKTQRLEVEIEGQQVVAERLLDR